MWSIRRLIESVDGTLKGLLNLEQHGGRTIDGVGVRIAQPPELGPGDRERVPGRSAGDLAEQVHGGGVRVVAVVGANEVTSRARHATVRNNGRCNGTASRTVLRLFDLPKPPCGSRRIRHSQPDGIEAIWRTCLPSTA